MTKKVIGRRNALKYFSVLAASAAGQDFLASWLVGADDSQSASPLVSVTPGNSSNARSFSPKFFSPEQYSTVELLTELIIPTDDQPGAKEAQVARYIDFVVFSAHEHLPHLQQEWTHGLTKLEEFSVHEHGGAFRALSASQQRALLIAASLPERDGHASHPLFEFYRLVKELTVEGFYTSKIGLVDVLGYQGCTYLAEFPGCTHPEHQS